MGKRYDNIFLWSFFLLSKHYRRTLEPNVIETSLLNSFITLQGNLNTTFKYRPTNELFIVYSSLNTHKRIGSVNIMTLHFIHFVYITELEMN